MEWRWLGEERLLAAVALALATSAQAMSRILDSPLVSIWFSAGSATGSGGGAAASQEILDSRTFVSRWRCRSG